MKAADRNVDYQYIDTFWKYCYCYISIHRDNLKKWISLRPFWKTSLSILILSILLKDNLENFDINKDILENIHININKDILGKKIHISTDFRFLLCFFWNIYIDFCEIIDIDKNIHKLILKISISTRTIWKILILILISTWSFLKISISISIWTFLRILTSIREFWKISIKYHNDKNLAYRTGLGGPNSMIFMGYRITNK